MLEFSTLKRKVNISEIIRSTAGFTQGVNNLVVKPDIVFFSEVGEQEDIEYYIQEEELKYSIRVNGRQFVELNPGYDIGMGPVKPSQQKLYHITSWIRLLHAYKTIKENRCIGNPSPKKFTSLQDDNFTSLGDYLLEYYDTIINPYDETSRFGQVSLEVDVSILMKSRNIFHHPESLYEKDFQNQVFIIPGGIPNQAITRINYSIKKEK